MFQFHYNFITPCNIDIISIENLLINLLIINETVSQLIEISVEIRKLLFDVITTSFHPWHPLFALIGIMKGRGGGEISSVGVKGLIRPSEIRSHSKLLIPSSPIDIVFGGPSLVTESPRRPQVTLLERPTLKGPRYENAWRSRRD